MKKIKVILTSLFMFFILLVSLELYAESISKTYDSSNYEGLLVASSATYSENSFSAPTEFPSTIKNKIVLIPVEANCYGSITITASSNRTDRPGYLLLSNGDFSTLDFYMNTSGITQKFNSDHIISLSGSYYIGVASVYEFKNITSYLVTYSTTEDSGDNGSTDSGNTGDSGSDVTVTTGSQVHNFTENGTSSSFYSITGSLSKDKGSVTYNGLTLTQCLKMESSTTITFTTTSAGTLTLVFGGSTSASGKSVKIDGTSTEIDSTQVLTVDVAAGSHTISKDDSINLFYMVYTPEDSDSAEGGETEDPVALAVPTVTIDGNGLASWTAIEGASSYNYKINNGDAVNTTSLSVQLSDGDSIVVMAVGDGTNYSNSAYSNEETYTDTTPNPDPVTYTVTFVSTQGTAPDAISGVITIPTLETLEVDGYTFGGWYYDEGCTTGNEVEAGDTLIADTKIYAKWTENKVEQPVVSGSADYSWLPKNMWSVTGSKLDPDTNQYSIFKITSSTKTFTIQEYGTRGKNITNTTGKTFDLEAMSGGTREITVTIPEGKTATIKTYFYENQVKTITINGESVSTIANQVMEYTANGVSGEFVISLTTNICLLAIDVYIDIVEEPILEYQYNVDSTEGFGFSKLRFIGTIYSEENLTDVKEVTLNLTLNNQVASVNIETGYTRVLSNGDVIKDRITNVYYVIFVLSGINKYPGETMTGQIIVEYNSGDVFKSEVRTINIPKYKYTISYDTDGGNIIEDTLVEEGNFLSVPNEPIKTGYKFLGWYNDSSYQTKFDFNTTINSNITLYALWEKLEEVQVIFNYNNGDHSVEVTLYEGDKVTKPTDPTLDGYIFMGWYLNGEVYDFEQELSESIELNAEWAEYTEPVIPEGGYTYMDGTLYGDDKFVSRIYNSSVREIPTVEDIPSDAIFVSSDGNDNNSGTISSPLLSLSKALSLATQRIKEGGNGVVLMREGTYSSTYFYASAQGNEDNYLVVTNYPGETVKISGQDTTGLFHLGTSNYVIIEGITFCDNVGTSVAKGITSNGSGISHIIIKNNEFYNIRVSAKEKESNNGPIINFRGTKSGSSINNFLVYNNYIHDCTTGWSESLTFVGNCEYINVIGNKIDNTGNIGIDIAGNWGDASGADDQARYVVVRGNEVSNCNSPYARSYGIYCDGARDVIFENNIVYKSQGGIEIGSENKNESYPVKNLIVRNNLVYDNSESGITIGGYNPNVAGTVYNVEIYNNTVANNGDKDSGQLTLSMVSNVKIYNNIFYYDDSGAYIIYNELDGLYLENVVYNNNLYYTGATSENILFHYASETIRGISNFNSYDSNAICVDPLFININASNFRLSPNSLAIDSGISVIEILYDLDLSARINNIIDLGCYEN